MKRKDAEVRKGLAEVFCVGVWIGTAEARRAAEVFERGEKPQRREDAKDF